MNNFVDAIRETTFLVVDDVSAMRGATRSALRHIGADHVLTAPNGAEALKLLKSQPINIVLSDWNMPVMSGIELLAEIRSDPDLYPIPFIMTTAEGYRDRIQRAIDAGVSEILITPYTMELLSERIRRALRWVPALINKAPAANSVAVTAAAGSASGERSTILIVDDTPDNLYLLSELLKDEYRVRVAPDGAKALKICHSDNPPDLVLLDIMMPDMDGFEVAKRMREHPSSETIPVIFVSSMSSDAARAKGLELGAIDFIRKPIEPDVLKPRVRNFMRYVMLRKQLQADYDLMLETARLQEDVKQITRHDMKGPLAGIIGLVQSLAADKAMSGEHKEQLGVVEETVLGLLNMINLSTELFKIERESFRLDPKPVNIDDILRRLVPMYRAAFAVKRLSLRVSSNIARSAAMPQARGDAMLCYSMFQNLIKNACEAAPVDSVIDIKLYMQVQGPLRVVIENKGTVPAAIREHFFDKFVTYGKENGSGLGTYSARLLARAQEGNVDLFVSDDDNISRLTVTLPVMSKS
ncbi:response regulator [Candidatus Methylospira mobilis]|uniref:ATP-binding response regulator n=1 Tax=Candidatus Methylospira mobilis TaxID=1808979 RepID=UPI0028EC6EF8|nr:response regulator [Candidatus Methylospira mobilis]WNV05081.1 response regulator [Candidatus Methylospira mobilis]